MGGSCIGTAAEEMLAGFRSTCSTHSPHTVQEGCALAGHSAQDLSLQSSLFLRAASLNCVCSQGVLEVQLARKSSLETTAKGYCSQPQQ